MRYQIKKGAFGGGTHMGQQRFTGTYANAPSGPNKILYNRPLTATENVLYDLGTATEPFLKAGKKIAQALSPIKTAKAFIDRPTDPANLPRPGRLTINIPYFRPGDTVTSVAKRYGMSKADFLKANPEIKNPNMVKVGQDYYAPSGDKKTFSGTVQKGDTLSSLAKRYGTYVSTMQKMNKIQNPNMIRAGRKYSAPVSPKANIRTYKKGGMVRKTGLAMLHKGEVVLPKGFRSSALYKQWVKSKK